MMSWSDPQGPLSSQTPTVLDHEDSQIDIEKSHKGQVVVRAARGEYVQGVAIDKSTIWRLNASARMGLRPREREELIRVNSRWLGRSRHTDPHCQQKDLFDHIGLDQTYVGLLDEVLGPSLATIKRAYPIGRVLAGAVD
jgi:hypothetical protein